ncbi:EAL domain-containing protein [Spirulina sp. 06S082]|uniref:EAL domain-containing protein n=1 Tax=Spirulina sp. 06S082 TaxID=3110248 RepID=UPI002B203801|nr:EAL domain-containing protein [Spirulina sp. 06S082]MEA5468703.1 EAL domain-containing protein [Spirulina sp. 06S082]
MWQRFFGGVAAALAVGGLQIAGFIEPLENRANTLLFRLRGSRSWDDRIVIVGIDEKAIEELETLSWSRSPYTKLLAILKRSQPQAIVFDVLMPEDTQEDDLLAQGMKQGIPVILPVAWNRNGRLLHSPPSLQQAAIAEGYIALTQNLSGTTQAIEPKVQGFLSLGLAVTSIKSLELSLPQLNRPLWIDWPGKAREATQYSLADTIRGKVPESAFTDKIVLVGATAMGFDPLKTPYDVDPPTNGVYLHAATIDNLLGRGFFHSLYPTNAIAAWLIYGAIGTLLSFNLTPKRMRTQIALSLGAIVGWLLLCGLGFYGKYLLPVVAPIAVLSVTVFVTLLQRLVQMRAIAVRAIFYDSLTGLPKHSYFLQQLKRVGVKKEEKYAFLVLNLDRFGDLNADRGQGSSDRLLLAVSDRLREILKGSLFGECLLGRWGADEFLIFYPYPASSATVIFLARTIDECLQTTFQLEEQQAFSRISIGIALSWESTHCPEELLNHARIAMYQAKLQGKQRHAIFNPQLHQAAISLWQLESDFRQALGGIETRLEQEFRLHYQPIIKLETGRIIGFEALVRWQHPQRGLVSPIEFIPLAEETGLIDLLGQWVLYKACYQLQTWQTQLKHCSGLIVAVNLSPSQLLQPELVTQVRSVLEATGLDSHCLKLEITESSLTANEEDAIAILNQLRALGVNLSLDDFGIGYSSLRRLHRFPLNLLKIDKSFVKGLTYESESLNIIKTILELARSLEITVVAEGIETQEQFLQLRQLQCDYGQGYLFSKPLDAIAAETLLIQNPLFQ